MTLAIRLKLFIYLQNTLLPAETFGARPLRPATPPRPSVEVMSAEVSVPTLAAMEPPNRQRLPFHGQALRVNRNAERPRSSAG